LSQAHSVSHFDCGHASLNNWLKKRAMKATPPGSSARTYVVCQQDQTVLGYYALASGSVSREDAPGRVRRNAPDPVPIVLLARLAVDISLKGQGFGRGLLKDAFLRVYAAAEHIGIPAMLVHAIDEQARLFYLKHGFYDSPTNDMTLMLTINEIQRALAAD
jgi:predicted N-acetyltransferase YhbS